jgi:hypothetical protein
MRNRSVLRSGARRRGGCSEFVELARRMSIPADVAIHEFMDLAPRPRSIDHDDAPEPAAALVTING